MVWLISSMRPEISPTTAAMKSRMNTSQTGLSPSRWRRDRTTNASAVPTLGKATAAIRGSRVPGIGSPWSLISQVSADLGERLTRHPLPLRWKNTMGSAFGPAATSGSSYVSPVADHAP